jgi:hypothetical protein
VGPAIFNEATLRISHKSTPIFPDALSSQPTLIIQPKYILCTKKMEKQDYYEVR